jgi:hypothetical protein
MYINVIERLGWHGVVQHDPEYCYQALSSLSGTLMVVFECGSVFGTLKMSQNVSGTSRRPETEEFLWCWRVPEDYVACYVRT